MKTKIFYFSATGNSLFVAKKIAKKIGSTEIISIPKVFDKKISLEKEKKIGFIFPVYAWGMPRIVSDFINKISINKNAYVFAVATNAGNPAGTIDYLKKVLFNKGINLSAGFTVNEGNHSFLTAKIPIIKFMEIIAGKKTKSSEERLPLIIKVIKNNKTIKPEGNSFISRIIGNVLYPVAITQFKNGDRDFWTDEKCNGCGICLKICPRKNIKIKNKKVYWNHNCEFCFSCISWCPKTAIQYKNESIGKERSHNPNVKIKDFI